MKKALNKVREFHKLFSLPISNRPRSEITPELRALRMRLLEEEFKEYLAAEAVGDLPGIADALADMIYIALGTAVAYGIPLHKVFKAVHRANMKKAGPDGPRYRADGKVLKPDGWSPPDVAQILKKEGWEP